MAREKQAPSNQGYSQQHASTTSDPFGGDFSQERITQASASWPILQWHGGIANLVGDGDTMKINGGFFMEDDRIVDLGLDPDYPAPGFERITLRLGGNQVPGWGASMLHIAFIFTNFSWEDRENGRLRFPPDEYQRRKKQNPGTERELRGRIRALVGVRELMAQGVLEPLQLTVRGTYSSSINVVLRDTKRMADEATRLRRRAGHEGSIPREAFWVPIYAGSMEDVGEGSATSRVSRPKADIPGNMTREFLIQYLVEAVHLRPNGTFDEWANSYGEIWDEKMAFNQEEVQQADPNQEVQQIAPPNNDYYQEYEQEQQDNYYGQ
jgi:hypothetical protein